MKKLLFVMAFVMAVLVASAQNTHTPVKVADLPKAITDNISTSYTGFTIKDATKVTENNVVTFDVKIMKGTTNETLVYDKDGKFIRKMEQNVSMTQKPHAKSSEKSHAGKK